MAVARLGAGHGIVARQGFDRGDILLTLQGRLASKPSRFSVQIDDRLHLEPAQKSQRNGTFDSSSWRLLNHSCEPNARLAYPNVVALRKITAGEQITFDYNSTEFDMSEPFECQCGTASCSHVIRGFKHLSPLAKERLRPLLAPHLARTLDANSPDSSGHALGVMPPHPDLLHEFFRHAASRFPDRPALDIPPGPGRPRRILWTYRELDETSRQFAKRHFGSASPEAVAAILLPRTDPRVYALQLAALRSGAAYVCIDPSFPDGQVAEILADSGAFALFTSTETAKSLRAKGVTIPLVTDLEDPKVCDEPSQVSWNPSPSITPRNLAYVIYTSGTSGRPKGVQIEHVSIANLVGSDLDAFHLTPDDRVAQGSSAAYDSSVEETWLAWASGAALVILDDDTARLGPDLVPWLCAERITVLCPPPTLLRSTACLDPGTALPDLRLLYVGGEPLPRDIADRWSAGRRMVNGYGPTECSVTSLRAEVHTGQAISIGRPIPGVRAFILDEHLRAVPTGQQGELCLAGIALARGYRNRPGLDSAKFPIHPSLGRIYRTGDLAVIDSAGNFFCQGRIDAQVKIRGFRIELEAVEARLMECDGVLEAACKVQASPSGGILAAHVVPKDPLSKPLPGSLKRALASTLPNYMVPQRIGFTDSLPKTVGGKMHRGGLPDLEPERDTERLPPVPPRTEPERRVLEAVRQAMPSVRAISMLDDFFLDLGGDSLSAAMAVSALRHQFVDTTITVRDFYQERTLEKIAFHAAPETRPSCSPHETRSEPAPLGNRSLAGAVHALWIFLGLASASIVAYFAALHAAPWMISRLGWTTFVLVSPLLAMAAWMLFTPVAVIATLIVKKILIGRYQAGTAPVYGNLYLRHWMIQQTARLIPWGTIAGTEFLNDVLRALGARVGRRVHIHRGVNLAQGGWDLLELGDDVTLSQDASLLLVTLEARAIRFAPVHIESGATVEVHASVGPGARLGVNSVLGAMSSLEPRTTLPDGELWQGIPARPEGRAGSIPILSNESESQILSPRIHALCTLAATTCVGAIVVLPAQLAILLISHLLRWDGGFTVETAALGWQELALYGALECVVVAATFATAAMISRALGPVRDGVISFWSPAFIRVWIKTGLSRLAGDWLYGSLFWPHWLRLAGARIGRGVEISGLIDGVPEQLEIGAETFCADGLYLGGPGLRRGTARLSTTRVGSGCFFGNGAIIAAGESIPDGVLLGVCTVSDRAQLTKGTSWFGDPPFALPHREVVEFERGLTHQPSWPRVVSRVVWELMRFALPIPWLIFAALWLETVAWGAEHLPTSAFLLLLPASMFAIPIASFATVLSLKWLLLGKVRPGVHALWSCWASRWDFVCIAWSLLATELVTLFDGTPFLPWLLRTTGMRIGNGVVLGGAFAQDLADPDMIVVEDGATFDGLFQAHTFEDRALKMDLVTVRAGASIGRNAVLLYGCDIGRNALVQPLSVVLKHEHLQPGLVHQGFPTKPASKDMEPSTRGQH